MLLNLDASRFSIKITDQQCWPHCLSRNHPLCTIVCFGNKFTSVHVFGLELWNRILESLIKVGCPSRFKSFLSDFLTGRKPLLLWSF